MSSHPSSSLAQHRMDPGIFPHLVRTREEEKDGINRNQRNYLVQKKVVRPGLNFVTNGQPGKVKVVTKESRQGAATTTPAPSTTTVSTASSTNTSSPFTWLTNSYLFNGLPSDIFSLPSPMQWWAAPSGWDPIYLYSKGLCNILI